jgi:hypothetical protein
MCGSKFLDSHLKPYKCKVKTCEVCFSSTADLIRHERKAHAMHRHGDKPFLCTYEGCERGVPGNGFPRYRNCSDHMKRVHNDPGYPPDGITPEIERKLRKDRPLIVDEHPSQRVDSNAYFISGRDGSQTNLPAMWPIVQDSSKSSHTPLKADTEKGKAETPAEAYNAVEREYSSKKDNKLFVDEGEFESALRQASTANDSAMQNAFASASSWEDSEDEETAAIHNAPENRKKSGYGPIRPYAEIANDLAAVEPGVVGRKGGSDHENHGPKGYELYDLFEPSLEGENELGSMEGRLKRRFHQPISEPEESNNDLNMEYPERILAQATARRLKAEWEARKAFSHHQEVRYRQGGWQQEDQQVAAQAELDRGSLIREEAREERIKRDVAAAFTAPVQWEAQRMELEEATEEGIKSYVAGALTAQTQWEDAVELEKQLKRGVEEAYTRGADANGHKIFYTPGELDGGLSDEEDNHIPLDSRADPIHSYFASDLPYWAKGEDTHPDFELYKPWRGGSVERTDEWIRRLKATTRLKKPVLPYLLPSGQANPDFVGEENLDISALGGSGALAKEGNESEETLQDSEGAQKEEPDEETSRLSPNGPQSTPISHQTSQGRCLDPQENPLDLGDYDDLSHELPSISTSATKSQYIGGAQGLSTSCTECRRRKQKACYFQD